jgi:hypothetical protein
MSYEPISHLIPARYGVIPTKYRADTGLDTSRGRIMKERLRTNYKLDTGPPTRQHATRNTSPRHTHMQSR